MPSYKFTNFTIDTPKSIRDCKNINSNSGGGVTRTITSDELVSKLQAVAKYQDLISRSGLLNKKDIENHVRKTLKKLSSLRGVETQHVLRHHFMSSIDRGIKNVSDITCFASYMTNSFNLLEKVIDNLYAIEDFYKFTGLTKTELMNLSVKEATKLVHSVKEGMKLKEKERNKLLKKEKQP